jgi:hypothetical protein
MIQPATPLKSRQGGCTGGIKSLGVASAAIGNFFVCHELLAEPAGVVLGALRRFDDVIADSTGTLKCPQRGCAGGAGAL